ncbi:MAG: divergent polysaccharide deacetylase family protein [Pseudomonadales bacterium]
MPRHPVRLPGPVFLSLALYCALLATPASRADDSLPASHSKTAYLVIVMDDLGYNLQRAEQILDLPHPITFGVLPHAPHSAQISARAAGHGREVILHQPMEPEIFSHARVERGTLETGMTAEKFDSQLSAALAQVPEAVGVNNHTGSRLTAHQASMDLLMPLIRTRGLFFLDSRTTPNTVAENTARAWHVPTLRRDVFLDHVLTPEALTEEFARALAVARRQGHAVVIAHPHPLTLNFLEQHLQALPSGIALTSLQALVDGIYGRAITPRDRATLARRENPGFPNRSLGQ